MTTERDWEGPWAWLAYAAMISVLPVVGAVFVLRSIVANGLPDWVLVLILATLTVWMARMAHRGGWNLANRFGVGFLMLLILVGVYGGYNVGHPTHQAVISQHR